MRDSSFLVCGTLLLILTYIKGVIAADYIFEKDDPLPSLPDLKTYIDQHKHLPEIPSAKQMEEEGINLKEMNLMLLKKVEELTLHMIEQYEQMLIIQDENRVLRADIEKIKNQLN